MRTPLALALTLLALATPALAEEAKADPKADSKRSPGVLDGIGVLGASVSAGYGTDIRFVDVLEAGLLAPHTRIQDKSSALFSSKPLKRTERAVARLLKRGCKTLVGVDLLFWFAYRFPEQAERKAELAKALKVLADAKVTLFVGDVPVLEAPRLKDKPSAEQLAELNTMIHAWAKQHPHVHVLPFSQTLEHMRANKPFEIGGQTLRRDPKDLFQKDLLHVTVKGQALLGYMTLHAMQRVFDKLPKTAFPQKLETFEAALERLEQQANEEKILRRAARDLSRGGGPRTTEALRKATEGKLSGEAFEAALKRLEAKGRQLNLSPPRASSD